MTVVVGNQQVLIVMKAGGSSNYYRSLFSEELSHCYMKNWPFDEGIMSWNSYSLWCCEYRVEQVQKYRHSLCFSFLPCGNGKQQIEVAMPSDERITAVVILGSSRSNQAWYIMYIWCICVCPNEKLFMSARIKKLFMYMLCARWLKFQEELSSKDNNYMHHVYQREASRTIISGLSMWGRVQLVLY